jgi:hypothetical protein
VVAVTELLDVDRVDPARIAQLADQLRQARHAAEPADPLLDPKDAGRLAELARLAPSSTVAVAELHGVLAIYGRLVANLPNIEAEAAERALAAVEEERRRARAESLPGRLRSVPPHVGIYTLAVLALVVVVLVVVARP